MENATAYTVVKDTVTQQLKMCIRDRISVYEELADFYRENVKEQYKAGRVPGMTIEPQVPQELLQKAKAYTDTAVISICRFSGEGWDRKSIVETENKNIWASEEEMARRSAEIFEDGDFYLTHAEQELSLIHI